MAISRHIFRNILIFIFIAAGCINSSSAQSDPPKIGIFYFPGWKDGAIGLAYSQPWKMITPFPERKPVLGWYDDGKPEVMAKQLRWMQEYGIDYVIFDWYWNKDKPLLDHAVQAYLKVPGPKPKFALMWSNHDASPRGKEEFLDMMHYVTNHFLNNADYLKIQGKPAFFVQIAEALEKKAQSANSSSAVFLADAQDYAVRMGVGPIFFAAGAGPGFADHLGKKTGYSAYFAYNYHTGPKGLISGEARFSRSYQELDSAYRDQWAWFIAHSDLPYIVPVTSGWDKRPWGGSKDPLHDQSRSTPSEFLSHLQAARKILTTHSEKTLGLVVACCWNEYGEGSIIEPTEADGFTNLEAIRSTFAPILTHEK